MAQDDLEDAGVVLCAVCRVALHPDGVVPVTLDVSVGADDNVAPGVAVTKNTCGGAGCMAIAEVQIRAGRATPDPEDGAAAVTEFDRQYPKA